MVLRVDNCALNTRRGKRMNLKYITCSDPREFNDIHDIVALGHMSPRVEVAVQAHPSKMSPGMARNDWFRELLQFVKNDGHNINLAVHVNRDWCDQICRTGKFPTELQPFFDLHHDDKFSRPLVARWQLNIPRDTVNKININALKQLLNNNLERRFIVQYNDTTRDAVTQLFNSGAYFSVLYDASGGRGIAPKQWYPPVFSRCPQGYSGGLSPENVADNLEQISKLVNYEGGHMVHMLTSHEEVWIDAEGKLKTDDRFDIARARQYVINAENWLNAKQR